MPRARRAGRRRATLCAEVDRPEDLRASRAWLLRHREDLTFVSDDEGCGCCIHMWRVEGPAAIIASIPPEIVAADGGQWDR